MTDPAEHRQQLITDTMTIIGLVVATLAVIGVLFVARHFLMLVFGAVLIGVVVNRFAGLVTRMVPWKWSRRVRVGLVLLATVTIFVIGGFGFASSIDDQLIQFSDRIDSSASKVIEAAKQQPIVQRVREEVSLGSMLPSSGKSLGLAQTLFASTFGVLTDVLILIILGAYFSTSPGTYQSGVLRSIPVAWREKGASLLSESAETLWQWMLGRLLAMAIVGISFGVGLAILGVPMPFELGIFAGLVTFVPNLGGIAAVVPALLLASNEGSSAVLGVLLLYLVIQFAESYLITPLVQEKQVNLPPAMVILAQVVAGLLFGVWGIMFATPLVALTLLWVRRLYVEDGLEAA
ncbi:Predicted PurR-regulated permease PerM [Neorhodopirellula lusitana]|uniref:Predicted PurR-regulated permease PerM n=1 Tax=Neorhodopirellula lusitana TaxID=445327 RepID=A0ABY1Q495_9BACT|nr:AI-2E family transporter [Neorhodopirellula lusitana]SMP59182.1 Predicted PurR-regulated permease PerM [Neorhodopirellula lusitana]